MKIDKEKFKKLFIKIINITHYAVYGFGIMVMIIAFWGGQIAYVTGNMKFKELLLCFVMSAFMAVAMTDPMLHREE